MPRLAPIVCIIVSVMQSAAVPDHVLRRVASAVKQHRPHSLELRAVLRQASKPVKVVASHAAKRAVMSPADDARLDLSRQFRSAKRTAALQSLIHDVQTSKNDTSKMVLEPTILEAQEALQMLESVRATLEEVSGLQQVSADPVKSRASLAEEIAAMEGLVNGTDGSKWEPLLLPTIKAARQAYEDLGVPGNNNETDAAGVSSAGADTTAEPALPTEPPAMPYQEDDFLDHDLLWDDGYMTQYENQTSGDAVGSLPPPPGVAATAAEGLADGADVSPAGEGAVSLRRGRHERSSGKDGEADVTMANATVEITSPGANASIIATSQRPLTSLGWSVRASDFMSPGQV